MKKIFYYLSLISLTSFSQAASLPNGSSFDKRVQTIEYNSEDVVRVKTKVGVSTLIQLEDGENLNTESSGMGIGDANAWSLAVRGNNLFIKPTAENPDTNITLVSNKRTYVLALESVKGNENPSYKIKFIYPQPKKKQSIPSYLASNISPCNNNFNYKNYKYYKWGNSSIAPFEAWDDGQFTCFRFAPQVELPTIYKRLADGTEVLTNSHVEGDVVVVHEVTQEYRFRYGTQVLGVKTNIPPRSFFNYNGTSNNNIREIKR